MTRSQTCRPFKCHQVSRHGLEAMKTAIEEYLEDYNQVPQGVGSSELLHLASENLRSTHA